MAVTVETDITLFTGATGGSTSTADTTTDWSGGSLTVDTESKIQGTGCLSDKVSNTTLTFTFACSSTNVGTAAAIFAWFLVITPSLDTRANGGLRIGVAASTNTGDWYVGGSDDYAGGWQCYTAHTGRNFDVQTATAPNLAAVTGVRIGFKTTATTAKDNCFIDAVRWGTYLRIRGGDVTTPATFQDMINYDTTNSLGVFREVSGVVFCQAPIQIGSTTAAQDTYFEDDASPIILFKPAQVLSTWYDIKLQGGASNATEIYLGTSVGGQGVSGPILKSPLSTINRNFQLTSCYSFNGNTSAYTDETADINSVTANDVALPPIQATAANDAIYFGASEMFGRIRITIGTAGVYSGYTMVWQYYNGSAWAALTGVVDGTAVSGYPFKAAAGTYNVEFTVPFWNWTAYAVNSVTRYWVRCVVTSIATPVRTTGPLATQGFLSKPYIPYKITATDTNIDKFGFYGTSFFKASTIALQAYNANKQFLNCSVIESAEMIPDTGIVTSSNFVSSPQRAIRIADTSHNVTLCNFINCQTAIEHSVGGATGAHAHYNYDTLMFYGSTYDIENSAVTPNYYIDIDRINGSNPDGGKINNSASGSTTILDISVQLTLVGLVSGSDIVILEAGTTTELDNVQEVAGTTYMYGYSYVAETFIDVGVFMAGYVPFYIRNYELGETNSNLPINQIVDRAYLL